jgi:hypothetical protein
VHVDRSHLHLLLFVVCRGHVKPTLLVGCKDSLPHVPRVCCLAVRHSPTGAVCSAAAGQWRRSNMAAPPQRLAAAAGVISTAGPCGWSVRTLLYQYRFVSPQQLGTIGSSILCCPVRLLVWTHVCGVGVMRLAGHGSSCGRYDLEHELHGWCGVGCLCGQLTLILRSTSTWEYGMMLTV